MKKFKLIPSMLMMVLSMAVLVIGIYAVSPTQNNITGTISVKASNSQVIITAYKTTAFNEDGSEAVENKLVGPVTVRAGAEIPLEDALVFNGANANTPEEVDDVVIVLKLENKSKKELGAYFYEGMTTDIMPEVAEIDDIRVSYLFKQSDLHDDEDAIVKTSFSGYSRIAPDSGENDGSNVTYMNITFKLNKLVEDTYTANFDFPLNIETYNDVIMRFSNEKVLNATSGLMLDLIENKYYEWKTASNDIANPTMFDADCIASMQGMSIGITNLTYTPALNVGARDVGEIFSFNLEVHSSMITDSIGNATLEEILKQSPIIMFAPAHIFVENNNADEAMGQLVPLTQNQDFVVSGNVVTILETANTTGVTEWCMFYLYAGDFKFSLSTPSFVENEKLEIAMPYTTRSMKKLLTVNQSTTHNYSLEASTDSNIAQKVSFTTSRLSNIPRSKKAVRIYANVPKGNMYLMQENMYKLLYSSKTLSEVIAQIELENDESNRDVFVNTGIEISENSTMFEVPNFWCENGNLNFITIILSDSTEETIDVNYSFEYSNEIVSEILCYTLVTDATNGDYYTISSPVSSSIEHVKIPATFNNLPVKGIEKNSFSACMKLKELDASDAIYLESIGDSSFSGCTGLESLNIPASVTNISTSAFNGCIALESIMVDSRNNVYSSPEGSNGIMKGNELIVGCKSTIIPESATTIGANAFKSCTTLKSIHIPASITSINNTAFEYCSNLQSITVSPANSVYSSPDGSNAILKGTELVIGCKNTIIPETVTSIGSSAFKNCNTLSSITIPENVKSIGSNAFYGCSGLSNLNIENGVTSIGAYAFNYCTSLISITIPKSITSIGSQAFYGCDYLEEIYYNASALTTQLTTNTYPFGGAGELSSGITVTFGKDVTEVPKNLFYSTSSYYAPNIKVVKFESQSTCKTISSNAFYGCTGLTSISIPASVTSIDVTSFNGCINIENITVANGNTTYSSPAGSNAIIKNGELVLGCKTTVIPNSVTSIGAKAFYGCTGLTRISIPSLVASIGREAFMDCSGLLEVDFASASSLATIDDDAFYRCYGLTSITVPESVTNLVDGAFSLCTHLTEINYNATSIESITKSSSSSTMVGVFAGAGKESDGITFNVGSNVTVLPNNMFTSWTTNNKPNLIAVDFEENSKITVIGGIFSSFTTIKRLTIPSSITLIDGYEFYNCTGITEIYYNAINATVSSSSNYRAFDSVGSNTDGVTVYVGANVESIPGNLFYCNISNYEQNITSVIFAEGSKCTSIGTSAFEYCLIESIDLPDSITYIGSSAFESTRLKNITLPASLTEMGYRVFDNCAYLTEITILAINPPAIFSTTFPSSVTAFYVPKASKSLYVADANWATLESKIFELN